MSKRPLSKRHYIFHQNTDYRWITDDGLFLSDVISSDVLRQLLMTPYNLLFRLSDRTICFEVRRFSFSISVYITRYLDV